MFKFKSPGPLAFRLSSFIFLSATVSNEIRGANLLGLCFLSFWFQRITASAFQCLPIVPSKYGSDQSRQETTDDQVALSVFDKPLWSQPFCGKVFAPSFSMPELVLEMMIHSVHDSQTCFLRRLTIQYVILLLCLLSLREPKFL